MNKEKSVKTVLCIFILLALIAVAFIIISFFEKPSYVSEINGVHSYYPKNKDFSVSEENAIALETYIESDDEITALLNAPVNINTASKEVLKSLDGIGDSLANKIIAYRNTNRFDTIEEIKEVSGIGEVLFSKIKDKICVE